MSEPEVQEAYEFLAANLHQADMLGEVGLDYKHATTEAERTRQQEWLTRQLELAAAHGKPVNLHSRRALRRVMENAIQYQEKMGGAALLHWFTQSKKLIRLTNEAGVYASAGPLTLLSDDACAVAASVDADLLLTETDGPVPFGGESARPAWVRQVLHRLAEARGVEPAILEAQIEENFSRLAANRPPPRRRAGGREQ
jgi:TatD DNase family protein